MVTDSWMCAAVAACPGVQEMPCDIYIGLVYYQRLRHMVSDKFQVRVPLLHAMLTSRSASRSNPWMHP